MSRDVGKVKGLISNLKDLKRQEEESRVHVEKSRSTVVAAEFAYKARQQSTLCAEKELTEHVNQLVSTDLSTPSDSAHLPRLLESSNTLLTLLPEEMGLFASVSEFKMKVEAALREAELKKKINAILDALSSSHADAAMNMLLEGVDLEKVLCANGYTIVHHLAWRGRAHLLRDVFQKNPSLLYILNSNKNWSLLDSALVGRRFDTLILLLTEVGKINQDSQLPHPYDKAAWIVAKSAFDGKLRLDHSILFECAAKNHHELLTYYLNLFQSEEEKIKILTEKEPKSGCTTLALAAKHGSYEALLAAINHWPSSRSEAHLDKNRATIMHHAAGSGSIQIFSEACRIMSHHMKPASPLIGAADAACDRSVPAIMRDNILMCDAQDRNVMHYAVAHNALEMVKYLLTEYPEKMFLSIKTFSEAECSMLSYAIKFHAWDVVSYFLRAFNDFFSSSMPDHIDFARALSMDGFSSKNNHLNISHEEIGLLRNRGDLLEKIYHTFYEPSGSGKPKRDSVPTRDFYFSPSNGGGSAAPAPAANKVSPMRNKGGKSSAVVMPDDEVVFIGCFRASKAPESNSLSPATSSRKRSGQESGAIEMMIKRPREGKQKNIEAADGEGSGGAPASSGAVPARSSADALVQFPTGEQLSGRIDENGVLGVSIFSSNAPFENSTGLNPRGISPKP